MHLHQNEQVCTAAEHVSVYLMTEIEVRPVCVVNVRLFHVLQTAGYNFFFFSPLYLQYNSAFGTFARYCVS